MNLDQVWEESFNKQIADLETRTGTNPTDWRKGGLATKSNPDKEDKVWWDENGRRMFYDFINVWQESHIQTWVTPQGLPAVELEFNSLFGEVPIKAYADLIGVLPTGELAVIDFKTGRFTPDNSMQLGVYACCMEMTFGIRPTRGFFYSARKAQFEEATGMDRWTIPVMTEMFAQFSRGIEQEIFLPNMSNMICGTCGVRDYCYAQGGQLSTIYDPLANIKQGAKNGSK